MRHNLAKPDRLRSLLGVLSTSTALLMSSPLPAQDPATPPASGSAKADPVLLELVQAHNEERAREKLPPLKLEPRLEEAAKVHAKDMADHDSMSHDGSDGSKPRERVIRAGYHYLTTGENVARGYRDVKTVMQSWMDSPPHKKNVLGDFTEIGLAVAYDKEGQPHWCVEFGKPMPKFDPATAAADLVKRVNEARTAEKQPGLSVDPKLAKFAQEQATNLARKKATTASFDGLDQRPYQDVAMSSGTGHPNAESMLKSMLDNPELKTQLIGKFARIGTGYATAEDGTPFWCLILANPARR
jgi:uncharacterized protein YkwD